MFQPLVAGGLRVALTGNTARGKGTLPLEGGGGGNRTRVSGVATTGAKPLDDAPPTMKKALGYFGNQGLSYVAESSADCQHWASGGSGNKIKAFPATGNPILESPLPAMTKVGGAM